MTPALVCATAEIAINRFLRLENSVIEDCARLSGRIMQISLPSENLKLAIEFIDSGVRVLPEAPSAADVAISGTPTALFAAMKNTGGGALPSGLQIEGDVELLEKFRSMVTKVGFDPEEWMVPMLGGAAAHRLSSGLKQLFGWSQINSKRMADHTAEYLREESYDLARGRDVSHWMDEVDRTRDSLDRLEARLNLLEAGYETGGAI